MEFINNITKHPFWNLSANECKIIFNYNQVFIDNVFPKIRSIPLIKKINNWKQVEYYADLYFVNGPITIYNHQGKHMKDLNINGPIPLHPQLQYFVPETANEYYIYLSDEQRARLWDWIKF